jgi:Asp-tRNA(Asn)/Glu-tRNA(Gln) amidotransferase C subunit
MRPEGGTEAVTTPPRVITSPEQVRHLAALAGLNPDDHRLASLAHRLQAMLDGASLVRALPLRDVEPATVFRLSLY